jgi:hypothetical protein
MALTGAGWPSALMINTDTDIEFNRAGNCKNRFFELQGSAAAVLPL